MRSVIWVAAISAALGWGGLLGSARADNTSGGQAGPVDTQVDVRSNSLTGATFTAPETGLYHFTIVSGAFCYLPQAGQGSPYGGWLTQLQIYTRPVVWGAPDQWGKHPIKPDAIVGDWHHRATSAQAAAAGQGATVAVTVQRGTRVTLLVSDGSNYYGDNLGVVKVRITGDSGAAGGARPSVPPGSGTPGGGSDASGSSPSTPPKGKKP